MENRGVAPFLTSGQIEALKLLAVAFMALDHANKIIWHGAYPWMLDIGRLAYPLFAFVLAYNYHYHNGNLVPQLKRLFIFALITEPIYVYCVWPEPRLLNIFFTLFASAAILHAMKLGENEKVSSSLLLLILFTALGAAVFVDYQIMGVLIAPALVYWFKTKSDFLIFIILILTAGANWFLPISLFALMAYAVVYAAAHIDIKIERLPKYFYYIFYPAHFVILKALSLLS